MKNKIILDLCGGTGAWSKPYKEAGYEVHNITLPKYDITKWDSPGEYPYLVSIINSGDVYGILAAPPCTEFSKAKTTKPRDFEKGMKTIKACLDIIWYIQERNKLQFWALENPEGLLRRFLGNPPYRFEQWWFGNDRCKKTDLWGRFKEPKRTIFEKPVDYKRASHNKNADWYSNSNAAQRAITPAGFAQAFFKANQ